MRKRLMLATILAVLAIPATPRAQITLGLRLGYGSAMGDAGKPVSGGEAIKMSDFVGSQIPIQLDALYRITPEWAAGVYFAYGFGKVSGLAKDICDVMGEDCSASSLRLGVQGTYTFTKLSPTFLPWAGVGAGYETLTLKQSSGTSDMSGWEFLNLQVGCDYKVNPGLAVGPYLTYSMGQFSSVEGSSIPEKTMHEWFNVGVRGRFDL